MTNELTTPPQRRWLIPAAAGVTALIVGGVIGWGATSAATSPTLAGQEKTINSLKYEISQQADELERTEKSLDNARDDLAPQREVARRESAVKAAEEDIAAREQAVTDAEAALAAREGEVAAREDAGEWWVAKVRDCFSRSGGIRSATVTAGGVLDGDSSCITM